MLPDKMNPIWSRPIAADERETVITFLRREGYSGSIRKTDRLFVCELAGEIVGAVRLSRDEGVLVLRGMRVRNDVQRNGVGTHLLNRVVLEVQSETCYCIPYRWLISFYAQAGFREVTGEEIPAFIASRHAKYVNDGLDVVLMYRPPN
jgi:N-acetylglutamate synthase-like GNAT family acetyltransferase